MCRVFQRFRALQRWQFRKELPCSGGWMQCGQPKRYWYRMQARDELRKCFDTPSGLSPAPGSAWPPFANQDAHDFIDMHQCGCQPRGGGGTMSRGLRGQMRPKRSTIASSETDEPVLLAFRCSSAHPHPQVHGTTRQPAPAQLSCRRQSRRQVVAGKPSAEFLKARMLGAHANCLRHSRQPSTANAA